MFRRTFSSALIFAAMSAAAGQALAQTPVATPAAPLAVAPTSNLAPELAALRETFAAGVPAKYQVVLTPELQAAQDAAIRSYPEVQALTAPEFLVVVNRHAKAQSLSVVLTDGKTIEYIGSAKVSTGDLKRKKHFHTPIGLFENKREFGNYRAEGTKNENGIRGYGKKGMRVFDFGWQESVGSWGRGDPAQIRLQMHATDPDILESKLGNPASQGCVRIQAGVNTFIDQYGVMDKNYGPTATDAPGWVLSKSKKMNKYDGRYMIVMEHAPAPVVTPTTATPAAQAASTPTTGAAPAASVGTTPAATAAR